MPKVKLETFTIFNDAMFLFDFYLCFYRDIMNRFHIHDFLDKTLKIIKVESDSMIVRFFRSIDQFFLITNNNVTVFWPLELFSYYQVKEYKTKSKFKS